VDAILIIEAQPNSIVAAMAVAANSIKQLVMANLETLINDMASLWLQW
jgi:hypothetical protein